VKRTAFCLIFSLLIFPFASFGQPCGGGPDCGSSTPITGIEILVGLGGLFGVRRIYNLHKKRK